MEITTTLPTLSAWVKKWDRIFVVTPNSFRFEDSSVIGYVLDPSIKEIRLAKSQTPYAECNL